MNGLAAQNLIYSGKRINIPNLIFVLIHFAATKNNSKKVLNIQTNI